MLNGLLAVAGGPSASATCTVKFDTPAPLAVPLIAPVLVFNCKPGGNVPATMLHT